MPSAERLSIVDAIQGFQVAGLLSELHSIGVLAALSTPSTGPELTDRFEVDGHLLDACLAYLAGCSDLIERSGDRYSTTAAWDGLTEARLEQYVGAYRRHVTELRELLRRPDLAGQFIDRERHAASYSAGASTVTRIVADLVVQLELRPTLDLGCGTATMLIDLATRADSFVGWGVDANSKMCDVARSRVASAGFEDRIAIATGDGLDPATLAMEAERVASVTATSLLNELWHPSRGGVAVRRWLAALAERLPGRALIVADYFGRLGHADPPWRPETAMHDLVQALSGQGVPPADDEAWLAEYRAAGIDLLHQVSDEEGSFFVHLLRLPTP